ncbi:hypothetical protein PENSPDRAFT_660017 [Peniophora sp. CONT]|nr:hypothetical protein PENSPDRAFT_660017 [Peniophora sp. CONT]
MSHSELRATGSASTAVALSDLVLSLLVFNHHHPASACTATVLLRAPPASCCLLCGPLPNRYSRLRSGTYLTPCKLFLARAFYPSLPRAS